MRNMRGALWALGLAGATYAWRNRDRLRQQLGQANRRFSPRQLPDSGGSYGLPSPQGGYDQQFGGSSSSSPQSGGNRFGGTDV